VAPEHWPPTDRERAAARMRDAAFVVVLRAWLLRRRAERLVTEAESDPKRPLRPASREK